MALFAAKPILSACVLTVLLLACSSDAAKDEKSKGRTEEGALPVTRWDFRSESDVWTVAALAAMKKDGQKVLAMDLRDGNTWCPAYNNADQDQRAEFWVGLLSALAKHESTWNPNASGGGGRWLGLTQIAPMSANFYGCGLSRSELFVGEKNLACAVKIMEARVPSGGVVTSTGSPWKGMSRDWAPFRKSAKRAEMAGWTSKQAYCVK
ncbi:MAG: transglycosylase SLT domain-containing protein [Pseudoruegeria sp.]